MKHDRLDGRSKHVDILFAAVTERHILGHVRMNKIATEENKADFLTKVASVQKFKWCMEAIGRFEMETCFALNSGVLVFFALSFLSFGFEVMRRFALDLRDFGKLFL
jgi:hypothetical protein